MSELERDVYTECKGTRTWIRTEVETQCGEFAFVVAGTTAVYSSIDFGVEAGVAGDGEEVTAGSIDAAALHTNLRDELLGQ